MTLFPYTTLFRSCQFCPLYETTNHLFLHCQQAQHIWFWLGQSQNFFLEWTTCSDIFLFSNTLSYTQQQGFLVVFSAYCWTLWKHRNELCFTTVTIKSVRNIILLIISVVEYWSGNMDKRIKAAAAAWLPEDIHAIPLRVWNPDDNQVVPYQGDRKSVV